MKIKVVSLDQELVIAGMIKILILVIIKLLINLQI